MSKKNLGTLGEPRSNRLVKAFYEDQRLRGRVAILAGIGIGILCLWAMLATLCYYTGH